MLFLEHIGFSSKGIVFKDKMGRELRLENALEKAVKRMWSYVLDFELLFLRVTGFIPLYSIRYLIYLLAGIKIGKGSHIHMGAQFFDPTKIEIGQGCIVGQNCFMDGRDKLIIGDHVAIASDVMIYNSEHNINGEDFEATYGPVYIQDYAFIGPRVVILPGVKVGKGAVVAAGAVVTKDVRDFEIVGGVPAKPIGERKIKNPNYKLGRARLFQ